MDELPPVANSPLAGEPAIVPPSITPPRPAPVECTDPCAHEQEYRPGDWIIVRTGGRDVVGQVTKLHDPHAKPVHMLQICRYMFPEETCHRPSDSFWPQEVFKGREQTFHPCSEIVSRCFVLHLSQYKRARPKPHLWDPTTPIYLCESRYNSIETAARPFSPITNWKHIADADMDYYEHPLVLGKLQSPFLLGRMGPGRLLNASEIARMASAQDSAEPATLTPKATPRTRAVKRPQPVDVQSQMSTPPSAKRPRRKSPAKRDALPSMATVPEGLALPVPMSSVLESMPAAAPTTLPSPKSAPKAPAAASAVPHPPSAQTKPLPPGCKVVLNPTNEYVGQDEKPPYSYASLIAQAIWNAPEGRCRLEQIYEFIMLAYPYYRTAGTAWQNMLRHNLSLRAAFVKVARVGGAGKGNWWTLDLKKEPGGFDGITFGTRRQVAAGNRKLAEAEGLPPKGKHARSASVNTNNLTAPSKKDQSGRSMSSSSTSSGSSIATPQSQPLPSLPVFPGPPPSFSQQSFQSALPSASLAPFHLQMPAHVQRNGSTPPVTMTYQGGYAALSHLPPAPLAANRQLKPTSSAGNEALSNLAEVCSIISLQEDEAVGMPSTQ